MRRIRFIVLASSQESSMGQGGMLYVVEVGLIKDNMGWETSEGSIEVKGKGCSGVKGHSTGEIAL